MKNCNMELNNISPKKHWFALHVFRNTKELAAPKPKALARRQAAAGQKA